MKIWLREVYEKCQLSHTLNQAFLCVINNHREKLLGSAINANILTVQSETNLNKLEAELPKELFVRFNIKRYLFQYSEKVSQPITNLIRQKSLVECYTTGHKIENIPHSCFVTIQSERNLLSGYLTTSSSL